MHIRKVLAAQLEDRIDRLQASFAALNNVVRDKVAEIVGSSVPDLVRQAIRAVFKPPSGVPAHQPEDDAFGDDVRMYHHSRSIEQDMWRPQSTRGAAPERSSLPQAMTAVVFGLQTACWWLTRIRNVNLPSILFVGLCASGLTYALGPIAFACLPALLALTLVGQSTGIIGSILK